MPIKHAAFKHLRQTKKRTSTNRAIVGSIKDEIKKVRKAIEAKDFSKAEVAIKAAIKIIDKAQQNSIIKKNNAARKKSRLFAALKKAKQR